ncbi:MAG: DnaJ domain-containing protein [Ktedonobacterales bacterium]
MIRPDFYAVLGVSPVASADEIRQAYYQLARQHHPDAGATGPDGARFKLIAEAYQVLGTPQLRAAYDSALRLIDQRKGTAAPGEGRTATPSNQARPSSTPETPVPRGAQPALRLEVTLGQQKLRLLHDMTRMYVMAELGPSGKPAVIDPQPLDLALLIDRSNSMKGEKIFESIHAAQSILDQLHMDDLLTLVFFDDFVEVLADAESVQGRPGIEEALKSITVRGSTELAKGLEVTIDRLAARKSRRRAASLVLLTDGRTYGDEQRCFDLAHRAREIGVSITTLGLGAEWNRGLLDRLAAISGGSSHYVAQPADLTDYFQDVIHQLRATPALNMRLTFDPELGVHIIRATRVAPDIAEAFSVPTDKLPELASGTITASSSINVELGALVGRPDRETAVVLFELLLDPRRIAGRLGELPLGQLRASYTATQNNSRLEQLYQEVTVTVADSSTATIPFDPDVRLALQIVTAYRCEVQADSLLQAGKTGEAVQRIGTAGLRLQHAGESDLAAKAKQMARKLSGSTVSEVDELLQVRYDTKNLGLFHRLRHRHW